jgi:hypothetical protein
MGGLALALAAPACGTQDTGSDELEDTEWIGANSVEVNARITGELVHEASGSYANLATDAELQSELVTAHISYAKNDLERRNYYLNMLPDEILSMQIEQDGDLVTIHYEASVDMVRPAIGGETDLTVDDLPEQELTATLPHDPVDVHGRAGKTCASNYGSYTLTEYKYFYYFDADKADCELPMTEATIKMVAVYENPEVYPEYDRLLNPLDGGGTGFRAAILPNLGDSDPMSRFDGHRRELDDVTGVTAEELDGMLRYRWTEGGATIVVDLFDPTDGWFTGDFHDALGDYQLVYYNGHSNYGHQPFLDEPEVYSDDYQIIGMHSCKSYSYYAHQVATGKATEADPTGWANADMVATGRSSYPYDSPDVMAALLEGLMNGLSAVAAGEPERASSWQAIGERMRDVAPSILYGVAGARNNQWTPGLDPEELSCSHDLCETGAALDPSCDPCAATIAGQDAYCTDNFWDEICVEQVVSACQLSCN